MGVTVAERLKLVYIAGPFRAMSAYIPGVQDIFAVQENIMVAMKVGANTMFFTAAAPDEVWLEGDQELLRRCDAILMTPNWQRSSGASAEHALALDAGIPVFYELRQVVDWLSVSKSNQNSEGGPSAN
jgi:hypothetical protein